ncbi:FadR family transcriptional regulator [Microbispora triticiradicis]|uniref:FadR family transcriptional regulator n=1 Tax=Microbispora triticiradicis TaxID=2200763 RepID=A0ABX9LL87_9ACTN|nr:FCD domain-containing protein [Microbispora triticiradicis]RGA04685.1 FadR family transcriptional regulator [Microbispora triticiradicis]GLW24593.1 GntR family transcriptional regulator [Microbispora amethystogenes]
MDSTPARAPAPRPAPEPRPASAPRAAVRQDSKAGDRAADGALTGGVSLLRPVRAGNAFEETVERLLQAIKLGVVAHGEKLPPERELANRLGISRVTLREAIRALQEAGYLDVRRGRYGGAFVVYRPPRPRKGDLRRALTRMGEDELEDALTFRMAVECGAARVLATTELTPDRRETLKARLAGVNDAAPADYRRRDIAFHLAIGELTGSPLLAAACADARLRVTDLLDAIPVLGPNIEHAAVQHAAIAAAILDGDPEAAGRAVAEHLEGTAALLRGFLA